MRTSDPSSKLVAALLAARRAFAPIVRDQVAQVSASREYRYVSLAALLDATLPALLEQGVIVFQAVDAESSALITRLEHVSGEWCESSYPLVPGLPPQQFGSLLTYAKKYSLQGLLCVSSEDDDGAAAQPAPAKTKVAPVVRLPKGEGISEAQRKRMFALAKASVWTTEAMKEFLRLQFGIESTKDLPASRYDAAVAAFEQPPGDMPF